MKAKAIKDRPTHRAALRRLEALMDRERLTAAAEAELELLGVLVERYEDAHWPVAPASPVVGLSPGGGGP